MDKVAPSASAFSRRLLALPWWAPYAVAALFMLLAIVQTCRTVMLYNELVAARHTLHAWQWQITDQAEHQSLADLRFSLLEARDPAYATAKIALAWNGRLHEGIISIQNLPTPTAGHDYQLWVLDPHAEAPVSAGVVKCDAGSTHFAVKNGLAIDQPGFAITLEPTGGSTAATGAVILALAPPTSFP